MPRTSLLTLALALAASGAHAAEDCRYRYGEPAELARCKRVELPAFAVESDGTSQPVPGRPMTCWHYRVSARDSAATAEIRQCHTGVLGTEQNFTLDGKTYTVLFDLRADCGRLPNGRWAPLRSGHAFLPGARDSETVRKLRQRNDEFEQACFGRNRKPA